METLTATVPARSTQHYPILIGEGSLQELPEFTTSYDSIALIYDKAVQKTVDTIASALGITTFVPVESGEKSKSLAEAERIVSVLLEYGINRRSLLINAGGGMLTDLGGFVASSYMRGVAHINVPTTLLGMVDASLGGKTGVNLGEAKNIVGHYHHPQAVVVDPDVLSTLSHDQFCEGLVEIIKIAAMFDANFFEQLEQDMKKFLTRESSFLEHCIHRAIALKAAVVEQDERDTGKRLLLNFGHTIGHALEVLSKYQLSHGQAVSIGMVCEMQLGSTEGAERVTALLERIGMPTALPKGYHACDLLDAMKRDKKATSSVVCYTAPQRIGEGIALELDCDSFMKYHA